MARAADIKTGLVRASFVNDLFVPKVNDEHKDKPNAADYAKYGCTLLIPKTDGATLKAMEKNIIEACVAANWGDEAKIRDMIAKEIIKVPVLDGDGKQGINKKTGERHPGYEGHFFIRVTSGKDFKPVVVDPAKAVIATHDPSRFKSGDYGYGVISAFTWDNPKNGKGVTFGIGAFQKVKDGEALGGSGGVDTDRFFQNEAVGGEDAPEETKGGAGAAGMFG